MMLPTHLLHPHWSSFWLPVMLDAAVKGTALLLLAGVLTLFMRRCAAASRHMVWSLVMLSLLMLPAFSAFLPGWQVLPHAWSFHSTSLATVRAERKAAALNHQPDPSAAQRPEEASGTNANQEQPLPDKPSSAGPFPPVRRSSADPLVADTPPAPAPTNADFRTQPVSPAATDQPPHAWRYWLFPLWLGGVLLSLLPIVLGHLSLWRLHRHSTVITEGVLVQLLRGLAADLGLKRTIRLISTPRRSMPMTWGILRPKLLLPEEAHSWPADRLRVTLLHELSHIKRCDCLTQLLARLACATYWFNPLAWLGLSRIVAEQERACDDRVITAGSKASDYAEHLLHIAVGLRTQLLPAAAAIAMARPSTLEDRLADILDERRSRRAITRVSALIAIVVMIGVLLPLSAMHASTKAADNTAHASGAAPMPPPVVETNQQPRIEPPVDPDLRQRVEEQLAAIGVARLFEDSDKWITAARELVKIGRPAVPQLAVELYRTDNIMVHRGVSIVLRAIGDARAVPALIHAMPKAEIECSDCMLRAKSPELNLFMIEHQMAPWSGSLSKGFSVGRPIREITTTLENLTSHSEGHAGFWPYTDDGRFPKGEEQTPFVMTERTRALFLEVADRWQAWWDENKTRVLDAGQRKWVEETWPKLIAPYQIDPKAQKSAMRLEVVDAQTNQPLPEVRVQTWAFDLANSQTTDASGVCTVKLPDDRPETVFVIVRKSGYVPIRLAWNEGEELPDHYRLKLPRGSRIGGTVLDEADKPVAGANVCLLAPHQMNEHERVHILDRKVTTDAMGLWHLDELPIEAAHVTYRVDHPKYVPGERGGQYDHINVELAPLRNETSRVRLVARRMMEGRVRDGSGKPVAGAMVRAQGKNPHTDLYPAVLSGEDGRFRIERIMPGPLSITVQAAGYSPRFDRIEVKGEVPPVEIQLFPPQKLTGRVVDSSTRAPIPSAFVVLETWRDLGLIRWSGMTDENGQFSWPDAPPDKVGLFVDKTGYQHASITATADQPVEPTVLLTPLSQIQPPSRRVGRNHKTATMPTENVSNGQSRRTHARVPTPFSYSKAKAGATPLAWIPYTEAKLNELRKAGKPVFLDIRVDFSTASKTNDNLLFNTPEFVAALKERGIVPMQADWTTDDRNVSELIEQISAGAGVPLWVIFPGGDSNQPVVLHQPELLTKTQLLAALRHAMATTRPSKEASTSRNGGRVAALPPSSVGASASQPAGTGDLDLQPVIQGAKSAAARSSSAGSQPAAR